jgi:hypothetical protein
VWICFFADEIPGSQLASTQRLSDKLRLLKLRRQHVLQARTQQTHLASV